MRSCLRRRAEAMMTLAANPRRLGAQIGVVAVLHTWGQALTHHPHALRRARRRSIARRNTLDCRAAELLPSCQAARKNSFRRLFLERLQKAYDAGFLNFFGDLVDLANPASFGAPRRGHARHRLGRLCKEAFRWNPPRRARLSRSLYTPRRHCQQPLWPPSKDDQPSLSPGRIIARTAPARSWKLVPDEFIRRFLLHTLPGRLPPHPPLRLHGQWLSRRKARPVSVRSSPNGSSAPRPRLRRDRGVSSKRQPFRVPRMRRRDAHCRHSFCALQIEALQTVRHPGAIRHRGPL